MSDARVEEDPIEKPVPSRAWRWRALLVISIACYGSYYAFDYIGPLAPLLRSQLHFSNSGIGLLQAAYSFPNIIAMLLCGLIIDRLGTRKSLAIFAVLIFAGLVITALSPRLGMMAAGRLLVGSGGVILFSLTIRCDLVHEVQIPSSEVDLANVSTHEHRG
jgi:predicted MFS family arabinose efflux permease